MAKDAITGIVLGTDEVQWAVLQRGRDGWTCAARGTERPDVPELEDADASTSPEEPPAVGADGADEPIDGMPVLAAAAAAKARGVVCLGVASDKVLLRVVRLPTDDDEDIPGMVELQVDKFTPFPLEQMTVSHEVLRQSDGTSDVLVAVVRTDEVEAAGELLRTEKLDAMRVDVAALAWWDALRDRVGEEEDRVFAVIDGSSVLLILCAGGVPVAFRTLQGLDDEWLVASLSREITMTSMSVELGFGLKSKPVITLVTRGGAAQDQMDDLAEASGCSVATVDLAELAGPAEGVARRAAVDGTLDLTPDSWLAERQSKRFIRQLVVTIGGIVGLWLLVLATGFGALYFEQVRRDALLRERERIKTPALQVRELRRRVFMVQQYMNQKESALESLREISRIQPPGVELTAFTYRKGELLKLSGEATSAAQVYQFRDAVDKSDYFGVATLDGPQMSRGGGFVFSVELRMGTGGGT